MFLAFRLPAIASRSGEAGGDESLKTSIAFGENKNDINEFGNHSFGMSACNVKNCKNNINIYFRRSRIGFFQFLPETEKGKKDPFNPVNPVQKNRNKIRIHSIIKISINHEESHEHFCGK